MKVFRFFMLVLLTIILQPQASQASCPPFRYPDDDWFDCPVGVEAASSEIGRASSTPLNCVKRSFHGFKPKNIKFFSAYSGRPSFCSPKRTFLQSPNGELQYVPLRSRAFYDNVREYASDHLQTPLTRDYSNLKLQNTSTLEVQKIGSKYCFLYRMKFPYKGTIYQCPSERDARTYVVNGEIDYVEGAFKWLDAYKQVLKKCTQFTNITCELPTADDKVRFRDYGGYNRNTIIKIDNEKKVVEYYLITIPFRVQSEITSDRSVNGSNRGMLLFKITNDGELQVKEIEQLAPRANELLELGNKLFKD